MSVSKPNQCSFPMSGVVKLLLVSCCAVLIASCSNTKKVQKSSKHINNETKFSSKEYGVEGSPRVTTTKRVKKGGGRYHVGKPYTIRGRKYYPKEDPNYVKTGMASWYGPNFHGRLTANGEIYDQYSLSAAHPTMPLPSYAKVTNLENGSSVLVRVNDRGPFAHSRIIDLSSRAAELLGYQNKGVAKVRVEYAGRARMDGLDEQMLMASYDPAGRGPAGIINKLGSQILLAGNSAQSLERKTLAQAELRQSPRTYSFVPIPQARPTTYHGIPLEISTTVAIAPTSLVTGYMDQSWINSRIDQAFSFVDGTNQQGAESAAMAPPVQGMDDLVQLKMGPFESFEKLLKAEELLQDDGILQRVSSTNSDFQELLIIAGREDAQQILEKTSRAGITVYSTVN